MRVAVPKHRLELTLLPVTLCAAAVLWLVFLASAGRLAGAADSKAIAAQWQSVGLAGRLLELVQTHPNAPRRITHVREYAHAQGSRQEAGSASGDRGWSECTGAGAVCVPLATTLVSRGSTSQAPRA